MFYYDLRLTRKAAKTKSTDEEPCSEDADYDIHQCIRNWNALMYMNQSRIDAIENCQNVSGGFERNDLLNHHKETT